MSRRSGKREVAMPEHTPVPDSRAPTIELPRLTKSEMAAWWNQLGGDKAFKADERAIEESLFVSEELLSAMVR